MLWSDPENVRSPSGGEVPDMGQDARGLVIVVVRQIRAKTMRPGQAGLSVR